MSTIGDSKTILEELLNSMGVDFRLQYNEESNTLEIDTESHALLIGKKGENLRALQYIFNLIRSHKNPDSEFVALDVAGYKKERIQKVQRIAEEAAAEVLHNGHEKTLPPMNSYERRQVHMVMADIPELVTRSVGDDPNRSIVISKRD